MQNQVVSPALIVPPKQQLISEEALPPRWRSVVRVVFPYESPRDDLCLYVEGPPRLEKSQFVTEQADPSGVLSRTSYRLEPNCEVSLGTYFNAFPASYWSAWTACQTVRLSVTMSGDGAVKLYKSDAAGSASQVTEWVFSGVNLHHTFNVPLAGFSDGGMIWFDVVSHDTQVTINEAAWQVQSTAPEGTASIGITTLNRPKDVLNVVRQVIAEDVVSRRIDRIYVIDHGTQHVEDLPKFPEVKAACGDKLAPVIHQQNVGGSGGASRGMMATVDEGLSDYHIVLDDDVQVDAEAMLRMIEFADHCKQPVLVGSHFMSSIEPTRVHSWGELVDPERFWWHAVLPEENAHLFSHKPLRTSPALHKRLDVDYNGWWMELIPVQVIRKVGYALPIFIKWDDAEYGVRAKEKGVPTVTLPGVAIWHVPWTAKLDGLDWQAYYHARNRLVAALLHPTAIHSKVTRGTLTGTLKHLFSQQYSVVDLRNQAVADVLQGPDFVQSTLATRLDDIRAKQAGYDDADIRPTADDFPPVSTPHRRRLPLPQPVRDKLWLLLLGFTSLRPTHVASAPMDVARPRNIGWNDQWAKVASLDSCLVFLPTGEGVCWYRRSRSIFMRQIRETLVLNFRLRRHWKSLVDRFGQAADDLVSHESWSALLRAATLNGTATPTAKRDTGTGLVKH